MGNPARPVWGSFRLLHGMLLKARPPVLSGPCRSRQTRWLCREKGCSQVSPGARSILPARPGFSLDPRSGSSALWRLLICWELEAPASSAYLLLTSVFLRQNGLHAEGQDGSEWGPVLPVSMSFGADCVLGDSVGACCPAFSQRNRPAPSELQLPKQGGQWVLANSSPPA